MMAFIFLILFSSLVFAGPCGPHEIYVREQWIKAYTKSDGAKVSAHTRAAHCREIERSNYFQDSTNQTFKGIKTTIKKWTGEERKIIEDHLGKLPSWLKRYKLTEVLRGNIGGNALNPAATRTLTRTLILFDKFFESSNKQDIINHEISHIAIYAIDPDLIEAFSKASGWRKDKNGNRVPPQKLLQEDSAHEVSEDFANHIEAYYASREKLMLFNPLSFVIIQSKENQ